MKIACSLAVSLLAFAATGTAANAGLFPDTSDKALAVQAQESNDDVPATPTRPTDSQLKARQRQREQDAKDKDWLVRSYENQLRLNSANQNTDDDNNLYYQIRTDKALASLAGMETLDPADDSQGMSFRTSTTDSDKDSASLRSDPSSDEAESKPSYGRAVFKPLITPLSASTTTSRHSFYSFDDSGSSAPASFYNQNQDDPDPTPAKADPSTDPNRDPANIDTPGMTAAEKDPALEKIPDDLMLDAQPKDANAEGQSHVNGLQPAQLPLTTNLARLNSQQEASLSAPGAAKKTVQPATVNTVNPLLLSSPNDPVPDKVPPPSAVRSPIADPFDIFNH